MTVTEKNTLLFLLLILFGNLFPFVSSATACTPVVYAFRHAEDLNGPPTTLKPVGMEHASLYVEMITAFEIAKDYCPVKFVYSISQIKPAGEAGTTNPFFTARPLANVIMNLNPITEIDNKRIDEFLETSNIGAARFRNVMLSKVGIGSSVALFWTSQGLPNLGRAIVPGFNIPETPKPPRNASYIFKFNGSNGFAAPLKSDQYVQCFNWANFRTQGDMSSSKYYCGDANNGNLSDLIEAKYLYKLHGRICNTSDLNPITNSGYYGYCLSP